MFCGESRSAASGGERVAGGEGCRQLPLEALNE